MFIGTYELKLDEKNRFYMPKSFFNDDVFVLTLIDKDLVIIKEFHNWNANSLINDVKSKYDKNKLIDYINANSYICYLSGKRITMPKELINKFDVSKELVLVGCGDFITMYDRKKYEDIVKIENDEVIRELKKMY